MKSLHCNRHNPTEVSTADQALHGSLHNIPNLTPADYPNRYEQKQLRKQEKQQRKHKVARKLAAAAVATSVAVGSAHNAFMYDQTVIAEAVWGNDKASVDILADNTERFIKTDTYIYVLPNTGVRDATPTALAIKDAFDTLPNSRLMSLTEGAHPQIHDTFNAIDETIDKENPPKHFILYGTSVGGKEALALADHLRGFAPDSDLSIILSSSPYNEQSAFALQGGNNKLPLIADIAARNNLHGGPVARIVAESGMKAGERCVNEYNAFDLESCIAMIKETARENTSEDTGSNELLKWQVEWTRVNSVGQDMFKLRNVKNGPRTDILYINTTQDVIVDEQQAIPLYKADARKNNIPMTVTPIDVPHSTEYLFPEKYNNEVLYDYFARIPNIQENIDTELGSTIRNRDPDTNTSTGMPYSLQ